MLNEISWDHLKVTSSPKMVLCEIRKAEILKKQVWIILFHKFK